MSISADERRDWRIVYRPGSDRSGLDVMRQAAERLVGGDGSQAWITRIDTRLVVQGRTENGAAMLVRGLREEADRAAVEGSLSLSYWSEDDDAWLAADLDTAGAPISAERWAKLRTTAEAGSGGATVLNAGSAPVTALAPIESAAPASWASRLGAFLIDALLVNVVALPVVAVAGSSALVVVVVLSLLYAPLMLMREGPNNGQTYGKQAMAIRVRREDGAPITFGLALLREWLGKGVIGAVTLYVNFLWPLWDARRQALHDKVAETLVVRVD